MKKERAASPSVDPTKSFQKKKPGWLGWLTGWLWFGFGYIAFQRKYHMETETWWEQT